MIPHLSIRAFVHAPAARAAVQGALADRHLARVEGELHAGGIAAAVAHHHKHPTPDVLIVEAEEDVLAELPALAEVCDARTRVLVIGQTNDVTLYKCVLQLGVSEYLVGPVDAVALVACLRKLFEEGSSAPTGKTYAFIGSRGGAGSSAISHSVAWLMADHEEKPVLLADLDMGFGAAALSLDVQTKHKLSEALREPHQIDAALLDRLLVPRGKHLRLLAPSAALVEEDLCVASICRLIELARVSFRRTVLDLPSEWTPSVREALLQADEVVVTALPDLISLRNTRAILEFLSRVRPNDPAPRLVLNQVGQRKRPELTPSAFVEALEFKPAAIVRSDVEAFGNAENGGLTVPEAAARSVVVRRLREFTHALLAPETARPATRRLGFWRRQ